MPPQRKIRSRTLSAESMRRQNRVGAVEEPGRARDPDRPRTRGDCAPGGSEHIRPCPWVACRHHLYLDVNEESGSIKLNFPDLEPDELKVSCSLDVADLFGQTLEEVGDLMQLTRERARQIETRGLLHLKRLIADPGSIGACNDHFRPGFFG